jgi:hypothetical protein
MRMQYPSSLGYMYTVSIRIFIQHLNGLNAADINAIENFVRPRIGRSAQGQRGRPSILARNFSNASFLALAAAS